MKKLIIFLFATLSFMQIASASDSMVMCTMDAKQCENGDWVGRTGPNCEFKCPENATKDSYGNTVSPSCNTWYDGCNNCIVGSNGVLACTKMYCTHPTQAYCKSEKASDMAGEYCREKGGISSTKEKIGGNEYKVCIFEEGRMCEEWALYRGDCPVGGKKLTGYIGDYAKYCVITGHEFINKGQDSYGNDIGDCKLSSGEVLDVIKFYRLSSEVNEYAYVDDNLAPIMCEMSYSPVCGNDGKTYGNSCSAQNVGVKYDGVCIGSNFENTLSTSWQKAVDTHLLNKSAVYVLNTLEKAIAKVQTLSAGENFDSRKRGAYNFIIELAQNTLHENIYNKYIKARIMEFSPVAPILGGKWYVTKIDWIGTNTALVDYEDGHIVERMKIQIHLKNNEIQIVDLEKRLEFNQNFNNKNMILKLKIPTSWESKYEYKFVSPNTFQFNFRSEGEGVNVLANINIFSSADWVKEEQKGLYNQEKLLTIGGYVLSYSQALDMPFTRNENITNYSRMISELPEVLESVDLIIK